MTVPINTLIGEDIQFLVVDLFCGAGGMTTGIEQARNRKGQKIAKVIACVNHDEYAIKSHEANHPEVLHFTEDIRSLDLSPLVEHVKKMRQLYPKAKLLLHASLECTNFSKAKGGKPRDADSRTLANDLFRYLEVFNFDYITIENVVEFLSWGPLDENGRPISRKNGIDFLRWRNLIMSMGYTFAHDVLNAADYGAYTSRKRLFIIFAKPKLVSRFPEPTHAKNPAKAGMFGKLEKWKAVKEVLDLEDQGRCIFDREKPLAERSLARIFAGLQKHVVNNFIIKAYSGDPKHKNISVEEPVGTVTTKDHHQLVQPFILKYNSNNAKTGINKGSSADQPCPTVTTQNRLGVVNAQFMTHYYGNGHNTSVDQPACTVTTKDRIAKVDVAWLDKYYSGPSNHQSVHEPAGALTTVPKLALATAAYAPDQQHFLLNPQYKSKGSSIEKPCFTLIARMDKASPYLVTSEGGIGISIKEEDSEMTKKIKQFMIEHGIVSIKMRMLKVIELKRIMGFPEDYVLLGGITKSKKYIGNAVEVNIACKLMEALAV